MSDEKRSAILVELAKHTGKRVPWQFVKQTAQYIPEIDRFHNLITGIYKPAWSEYALSVIIRVNSPYEDDEIVFLDDGRWLMTYAPRSGGLQVSDNRALVKCMDEKVPIAVFSQLTDKTSRRRGSTYRVLGLGLVTSYDSNADVFIVESADRATVEKLINNITNEEVRYEVELYSQVTNAFQPFVKEKAAFYTTVAQKRDRAFRQIIMREYGYACTVCGMRFRLDDIVEATAAHIIPRYKNGSDDPRNGISLCRTHHWAFDAGLFSISDDYRILLSPSVARAENHNFVLIKMQDMLISLPDNEVLQPHREALRWHRKNVWYR